MVEKPLGWPEGRADSLAVEHIRYFIVCELREKARHSAIGLSHKPGFYACV